MVTLSLLQKSWCNVTPQWISIYVFILVMFNLLYLLDQIFFENFNTFTWFAPSQWKEDMGEQRSENQTDQTYWIHICWLKLIWNSFRVFLEGESSAGYPCINYSWGKWLLFAYAASYKSYYYKSLGWNSAYWNLEHTSSKIWNTFGRG